MEISDVLLATKHDIHRLNEKLEQLLTIGVSLMSQVSDFAAAQAAFNSSMDASMLSLQADVQAMLDLIAKLQASPGVLSPEDQASLDALNLHSKSLSDGLAALDAKAHPALPQPGDMAALLLAANNAASAYMAANQAMLASPADAALKAANDAALAAFNAANAALVAAGGAPLASPV